MIQKVIRLRPMSRGFHLITSLVEQELPELQSVNVGIWQGIYFGEHRDHGSSREIIATLIL